MAEPQRNSVNSFIILKQVNNKGPYYKVVICGKTLQVLSKKLLSSIPKEWSADDFYHFLDEGKRFDISI